jgi:hypothetical protein
MKIYSSKIFTTISKQPMKKSISFLFILAVTVFTTFAQAQTVDEVINKHIEALGGKENLNRIENVVMLGSLDFQGTSIALTMTQVNNKLNRQDISVMGMTGFDMLTDKEGWTYMPFQGMQKPEPKPAEEVKENQGDLDVAGPLVDHAAKGHKVILEGKEDIDGKPCYKINASLASGKKIIFFIDAATHMINRTIDKRKINGTETDLQTDLADYKEVEGVKMAHSITQQFGTVIISGIKVNQVIPPALFKNE